MGTPKALVPFCGVPLICRSLKRLGGIASQLIVTSNDHASLNFLCSKVTLDKVELYADIRQERGALSGIQTALTYARFDLVAIVACDMVFPSAPLLQAEQLLLEQSGADVAVPRTSHGFEPFHAVYRRDTCLAAVEAALAAGKTRATHFFEQLRVRELSVEEVLAADPRGGCFFNVNTPAELERIEQQVLSGKMPMLTGETDTCCNSCSAKKKG